MRKKIIKFFLWTIFLSLFLFLVMFFSLLVGSTNLSIKDFFSTILKGKGTPLYSIIFDIRLPRIILCLAVGGVLSLAGIILQGIFGNNLVEPYTLGISGGAALGVCLGRVLFFKNIFASSIWGFSGAMITIFLLYFLTKNSEKKFNMNKIILLGVMISFICSSLIMLIMAISRIEELHGIILWIMGSFSGAEKIDAIFVLFFSLISLLLSYFFCHQLNAFLLGEEEASKLGIDVEKTKKFLFLLCSFSTAVCVSNVGIIGFVGLVVPHITRILVGKDYRNLLICSYLLGATFLILCDTFARTILPFELPVGVITGILGGSIFIYILVSKKETI